MSAPRGPMAKVWSILTALERRELLLLAPAVIAMALLETAGVASIVPFLGLLSDPGIIDHQPLLLRVYEGLGFTSRQSFFFAVGSAMLALVTVSNVVSALTTWSLLRFSWMKNHTLATRLLGAYLLQPYAFFLDKNSADLGKNILSEVQAVVTGVIVQGVNLLARLAVIVFVLAALVVLDPLMALGVVIVFGGVYGGLFVSIRRRVAAAGKERLALNQARFKVAQEALSGVKELKLYGLEKVALEQFSVSSRGFAERQAANAVVSAIPRYALETIAFGGVLLIVLYLLRRGERLESVLPVLGLYAFAAYRLLPALQTVFAGMTSLRFNLSSLDVLFRDLAGYEASSQHLSASSSVAFQNCVQLDGVGFRYEAADRMTLAGIDLRLGAGEWLAFVGPTGAGKSTLVDILIGLLAPSSGRILVDGVDVTDPLLRAGWQRHVAYVPQSIFLLDDTIAKNIAFGVGDGAVDMVRVREAASIAQIGAFIDGELPDGYETRIGERGVRLSGGQRQRIGIARALYRRPGLLVLDEATSALDNATEAAFFAALHASHAECAVVSIAHRLSTTRDFDRIVVLEAGRVVDIGSFAELSARSAHFQTPVQDAA